MLSPVGQVTIGSLAGDAKLRPSNEESHAFGVSHFIDQAAYLRFKYAVLNQVLTIGLRYPKSVTLRREEAASLKPTKGKSLKHFPRRYYKT